MKVLKFGGSSLADANQFKKVKDIALADSERKYIVVSAPGKGKRSSHKVTDLLLMCYQLASHDLNFNEIYEIIKNTYKQIVDELNLSVDIDRILKNIHDEIQNGASKDFTASRGEYINAILLANYLDWNFVDAKDIIFFKNGDLDEDKTEKKIAKILQDNPYTVIPGFYGSDENGKIKTFSRGGSDITGSLIANALKSEIYENWTDVSGFLVADPKIVENSKTIDYITYRELRELSYMGAPVLHEDSIVPVKKYGIPINIRNTNAPRDKGTTIIPNYDDEKITNNITGIAGKRGFSVITIEKTFMNTEYGFFRKIMSVFETNEIPIEHMPSSIDTVSLIVDTGKIVEKLDKIIEEIKIYTNPKSISVEHGISLIAIVGKGMVNSKGTSGKIFTALGQNDVNVRMISQGSSELNIIIGVLDKDFKKAIKSIYEAFNWGVMMKKYNVAVVGATGLVGRKIVEILEERNFPVEKLFPMSSKRSAGSSIKFNGEDVIVKELTEESFDTDIDIALFAAGGSVSEKFAKIAVKKGVKVVDNSSHFRMDKDVPLIVPEINPEDVNMGYGIYANPNCSTIQSVLPLKPLDEAYGLKRVVYSTYQAVSGSGIGGLEDLENGTHNKYPYQIAKNVIVHIDDFLDNGYTKEEMKMINETRKILHDDDLKVTATTARVPVKFSHCVSINVELEKEFDLDDVKKLLSNYPGIKLYDDPKNLIYPMPIVSEGKDDVYVGRIRRDFSLDNGINLWSVGDNTRKGAALNAVQIAELLIRG